MSSAMYQVTEGVWLENERLRTKCNNLVNELASVQDELNALRNMFVEALAKKLTEAE